MGHGNRLTSRTAVLITGWEMPGEGMPSEWMLGCGAPKVQQRGLGSQNALLTRGAPEGLEEELTPMTATQLD